MVDADWIDLSYNVGRWRGSCECGSEY